ncbi:MAG TPA: MbnP family protein [Polyangia bacterium]|nr:MbnP family protein [Polyangia bacterium]
MTQSPTTVCPSISLRLFILLALAGVSPLACQTPAPGVGGTGGSGGSDARPASPDASADGGGDTETGESLCAEAPPPRRSDGAILEIPIAAQLAGKVMRFGEANVAANGQTVTPLNLRFYLSNVILTKAGVAQRVPVDIVDAAGKVLPYGIHFYNADDPASQVLRVRAPVGDYSAITFSFGLGDDCNAGEPERTPPLSATSQMTWPHGFGYLFFRYEGRVSSGTGDGGAGPDASRADGGDTASADPEIPAAIHMGGFPHLLMAPVIRIAAPLSVPSTAGTANQRTLRLVMDEVFKGANTPVMSDLPIPPPGIEGALGESLRKTAPTLTLFVLTP